MSDIFERLKLQVQNAFDQEFFGHNTQLKNLLSQHNSFEKLPDQMTEEQFRTRGEDSFGMEDQSDSEHELPSSENLSELHLKSNDEPSTNHPRRRYAFKDRKPRQYANFQESFSEEEESEQNGRTKKTRKIKRKKGETKDSYPTKNFLPAFKGPHLLHLENTLGEQYVNSFPIVQQIQNKNGISMSDYEALYKEAAFDKAWKEMFATRQLYRDLMLSRSTTEARKIHIKKIPVFQKAFETKVFNRIN